jgi:hypothetical protein
MIKLKGCGRKKTWRNLRYYHGIFFALTEESHEKPSVRIADLGTEI